MGRDSVPSLAQEKGKVGRTEFKGGKLSASTRTMGFPVGLPGIQDLSFARACSRDRALGSKA